MNVKAVLVMLSTIMMPPVFADTMLNPEKDRITDKAIHADYAAYKSLQIRIKALNDGGRRISDYHLAKAQCWLDVSFHEYTRNDRSAFPQQAMTQSERLIKLMEDKFHPLPMDTPLVNNADRLRSDLWEKAAALKNHEGFQCAQQKIACMEIELVHAGNEHKQQGWRHGKPYVQIAEDLAAEAQILASDCIIPQAATPSPLPAMQQTPAPAAPVLPPPVPAEVPAPTPPMVTTERVTLAADALFNFDKSDLRNLRAAGKISLDKLIANIKNGYARIDAIKLVGHADRLNSTRKPSYNVVLGKKRADTIKQYLATGGIDTNVISTDSRGDKGQIVECKDSAFTSRTALRECLAPNRRVEVEISGVRKQ